MSNIYSTHVGIIHYKFTALQPGFARASGSSRSPSDARSAVASQGALVSRARPSLFPVPLTQEARRDLSWWMVRDLMLVGQPPSEMDGKSRHPSLCEVSSRTSQCPGRSPQLSRASRRNRVISSSSGGKVTASLSGQSVDRPFCDEPQCEAAPLLLACPGSPGRLRGRVSSSLG